jgi:hypothetical protein
LWRQAEDGKIMPSLGGIPVKPPKGWVLLTEKDMVTQGQKIWDGKRRRPTQMESEPMAFNREGQGAVIAGIPILYELSDSALKQINSAVEFREKGLRERINRWETLLSWGGTPQVIDGFIRAQQDRIHASQDAEKERDSLKLSNEELAAENERLNKMVRELNAALNLVDAYTKGCEGRLEIARKFLRIFVDGGEWEHEDPECPCDDTCECGNAKEMNEVLDPKEGGERG